MGCVNNISHDRFPRQGYWLGKTVRVVFHYDTSVSIMGKVIREDIEEPGKMIIQLENGWVVLSTECQFQLIPEGPQ